VIFLMVKCGVLFEVRTEFLNIIWTRFGFKGLTSVLTVNSNASYRAATDRLLRTKKEIISSDISEMNLEESS
jgi:hypothetical protein